MRLGEHEVAEARAVIRRALDEDLRYGPDVTTEATVPADATTTAALVAREGGVIAGVDVALLVLDEVLGMGGYRVLQRLSDGDRLERHVIALRVEARHAGIADGRADDAEPRVPPVRHRHRDPAVGGRGSGHPRDRA